MPRLVFHPDIALEIRASYEWYQNQAEGLGDDFITELESAFDAIAVSSCIRLSAQHSGHGPVSSVYSITISTRPRSRFSATSLIDHGE